MKEGLFTTIIANLLKDDFFDGYKFISSINTILKRSGDEFISVELYHWRDYEIDSCVIRPIYAKHFDVLCKWFEKYSIRNIRFQRLDPHIMLSNTSFGQDREITFKYDFSDYDEKYAILTSILKENLKIVAKEYANINDYYTKIVLPRFVGDECFPDVGAEWIFEYLTASYLLDKVNYAQIKEKVLAHTEWLVNHHELNVAEYYDRMDEIIAYMESNVTKD